MGQVTAFDGGSNGVFVNLEFLGEVRDRVKLRLETCLNRCVGQGNPCSEQTGQGVMNAATYRKLLEAFGVKLRYWARWFVLVGGSRGALEVGQ